MVQTVNSTGCLPFTRDELETPAFQAAPIQPAAARTRELDMLKLLLNFFCDARTRLARRLGFRT